MFTRVIDQSGAIIQVCVSPWYRVVMVSITSQVALLDGDAAAPPLSGFSHDDCLPFVGELWCAIQQQGDKPLCIALHNTPIIRVFRNSRVYVREYQVVDGAPCIEQHHRSGIAWQQH